MLEPTNNPKKKKIIGSMEKSESFKFACETW